MGRLIPVIGITLAVFTGAAGASDHDEARRLRERADILPLAEILERLPQTRDGRILEVELKHRKKRPLYEIELLDREGVVWELYFDAVTGELLKEKVDD